MRLSRIDPALLSFEQAVNQRSSLRRGIFLLVFSLVTSSFAPAQISKVGQMEIQPFAAQVKRLVEAMDYLGAPLGPADEQALDKAFNDTAAAQASAEIQKEGFSVDHRPKQTITQREMADRWLDLSMFDKPPFQPALSGLKLEYRIIQLHSRDAGKREAKISFNVGQGTQDIGFRNDMDILFTCRPSQNVTFRVLDERDRPTTASFIIRDAQGHIISAKERDEAEKAYEYARQVYRRILAESGAD